MRQNQTDLVINVRVQGDQTLQQLINRVRTLSQEARQAAAQPGAPQIQVSPAAAAGGGGVGQPPAAAAAAAPAAPESAPVYVITGAAQQASARATGRAGGAALGGAAFQLFFGTLFGGYGEILQAGRTGQLPPGGWGALSPMLMNIVGMGMGGLLGGPTGMMIGGMMGQLLGQFLGSVLAAPETAIPQRLGWQRAFGLVGAEPGYLASWLQNVTGATQRLAIDVALRRWAGAGMPFQYEELRRWAREMVGPSREQQLDWIRQALKYAEHPWTGYLWRPERVVTPGAFPRTRYVPRAATQEDVYRIFYEQGYEPAVEFAERYAGLGRMPERLARLREVEERLMRQRVLLEQQAERAGIATSTAAMLGVPGAYGAQFIREVEAAGRNFRLAVESFRTAVSRAGLETKTTQERLTTAIEGLSEQIKGFVGAAKEWPLPMTQQFMTGALSFVQQAEEMLGPGWKRYAPVLGIGVTGISPTGEPMLEGFWGAIASQSPQQRVVWMIGEYNRELQALQQGYRTIVAQIEQERERNISAGMNPEMADRIARRTKRAVATQMLTRANAIRAQILQLLKQRETGWLERLQAARWSVGPAAESLFNLLGMRAGAKVYESVRGRSYPWWGGYLGERGVVLPPERLPEDYWMPTDMIVDWQDMLDLARAMGIMQFKQEAARTPVRPIGIEAKPQAPPRPKTYWERMLEQTTAPTFTVGSTGGINVNVNVVGGQLSPTKETQIKEMTVAYARQLQSVIPEV